MIISTIIIYFIGAFIAYLIIGWLNDNDLVVADNKVTKLSILWVIFSWLFIITLLLIHIGMILENINIPPPSLSVFIKFFQKTKKNEKK